jgi:RNA polymerase sigma factor (sigma-70 family)
MPGSSSVVGVAPDPDDTEGAGLVEVDRNSMLALAYVLTGSHEDAQDIVQTVLVRLAGVELGRVADIRAYCHRAVTNECASWGRAKVRSRHRVETLSSEWIRRHSTQPDPYGRIELMGALRALPLRQRSAVVLRYYLDWNDDAIAETLGCAPATVRSILSRALKKLRTELGDDDHERETATS